jgi:hypothetical protein
MWPLPSSVARNDRPDQVHAGRARETATCALTLAVVTGIVAAGFLSAPASLLLAGDQAQPNSKDAGTAAAVPSRFVIDTRAALRNLREEIARLGAQAIENPEQDAPPEVLAMVQRITVSSAAANYENARLTREVAEIAVREYEQGIFLQDKLAAEGEVILAKADSERASDLVESGKQRLELIKKASKGSAADLANEYRFEDALSDSERREPKARRSLEEARAKLEMLEKYTRPRRVKELKCEVEKARAVELAMQARVEPERVKLNKLEAAAKTKDRPIHEQRVLTLLDGAIELEERLEARLDQVKNEAEPREPVRAEIAGLLKQLEGFVESARNEQAAAAWAGLKSKIPRAANADPRAKAK